MSAAAPSEALAASMLFPQERARLSSIGREEKRALPDTAAVPETAQTKQKKESILDRGSGGLVAAEILLALASLILGNGDRIGRVHPAEKEFTADMLGTPEQLY